MLRCHECDEPIAPLTEDLAPKIGMEYGDFDYVHTWFDSEGTLRYGSPYCDLGPPTARPR